VPPDPRFCGAIPGAKLTKGHYRRESPERRPGWGGGISPAGALLDLGWYFLRTVSEDFFFILLGAAAPEAGTDVGLPFFREKTRGRRGGGGGGDGRVWSSCFYRVPPKGKGRWQFSRRGENGGNALVSGRGGGGKRGRKPRGDGGGLPNAVFGFHRGGGDPTRDSFASESQPGRGGARQTGRFYPSWVGGEPGRGGLKSGEVFFQAGAPLIAKKKKNPRLGGQRIHSEGVAGADRSNFTTAEHPFPAKMKLKERFLQGRRGFLENFFPGFGKKKGLGRRFFLGATALPQGGPPV